VRSQGLSIGNGALAGSQTLVLPAKGAFDELRTYNYPLSGSNILLNYNSDLNTTNNVGVPFYQSAAPDNPNSGPLGISIDNPFNGATIY